ncbi:MAG: hypothetical protein WDZ28_02750 [Simkaniaceae bacterium]
MAKGRVKAAIYLLILAAFSACSAGGTAMTRDEFAAVDIGEPIEDVLNYFGQPYSIRSRGADCDIYEYIEKIKMDYLTIQQKRYYFVVTNGRVVGKYVMLTNPPPYEQIYNDEVYPVY